MQDELKNVISQAMNTNSEEEQESISPFEELSDEDLEAVAGGKCVDSTRRIKCYAWSIVRNANDKV